MSEKSESVEFFKNLTFEKLNSQSQSFCNIKPKKIGRIGLGAITEYNVKILKRLNQIIFPVNYNENFYKDVLNAGELARLAYYNDLVVGSFCCRVYNNDPKKLYVMTLGCLAPYRGLGIGRKMLEHILNYAEKNKFEKISLHVQVNNEIALEFYKKFGFEIIETNKTYYKKIKPPDAHVLEKTLIKTS